MDQRIKNEFKRERIKARHVPVITIKMIVFVIIDYLILQQ